MYEAGVGRVRRRYRDGRDATAEGELLEWLYRAGYPVPRVYERAGADLVMQRLVGPTMGAVLLAGELDAAAAAGTLATLHDRLHALRIGADPDRRVLHLDLHPFNVLYTESGPCVIDWSNAQTGEPALDVALSALIMAQAGLVLPPEVVGAPIDVAVESRKLLATFVAEVSDDPRPALDKAAARRRADPTLSAAERAAVEPALELIRSLPG